MLERDPLPDVLARLASVPELAAWPEALTELERIRRSSPLQIFDLVFASCASTGASPVEAEPVAAAILAAVQSVKILDDLLDGDRSPLNQALGLAGAANVASAFQSAATRVVAQSGLDPVRKLRIQELIAEATSRTARGQHLDVCDFEGEEAHWEMVRGKTPPLVEAALLAGAWAGSTDLEALESAEPSWRRLGTAIGQMIQIGDDIGDALKSPAAPDWARRSSSLTILYAAEANHPGREEFVRLKSRYRDPETLRRLQVLLLESGAVSYAIFRLLELERSAHEALPSIPVAESGILERLVQHYVGSIKRFIGIAAPHPAPLDS